MAASVSLSLLNPPVLAQDVEYVTAQGMDARLQPYEGLSMRSRWLTRRTLLQYGLAAAAAGPWALRQAHGAEAGPEEDRIIQAAKKLKPAELNGMIWSLYYGGPMNKQQQEF